MVRSPRTRLVVGLLTGWLTVSAITGPDTYARPAYRSIAFRLYPKLAEPGKRKLGCAMCHPGTSKRNGNHYSQALQDELKGKNVKDPREVIRAMKAIEDQSCPGEEATWGERLKDGKLPCLHGSGRHPQSDIERLLAAPEIISRGL